jgi:hypothetical protein
MKKKAVILIISVILLLAGIGCSTSLSYLLTPAPIDRDAVEYVEAAGIAEPNEYNGYGNLAKAQRLMRDVNIAHTLNQEELAQAVQRDNTQHSIHSATTKANNDVGMEREKALFGPTGLISMGMTLAGVSGVGLLGLLRKRPGDVTPVEMQSALAEATGRTQEELTSKEKQFTQLVKGVQSFMNVQKGKEPTDIKSAIERLRAAAESAGSPDAVAAIEELSAYVDTWNGDVILSLKAAMDKYQDTETKNHVAEVKNEIV